MYGRFCNNDGVRCCFRIGIAPIKLIIKSLQIVDTFYSCLCYNELSHKQLGEIYEGFNEDAI